MSNLTKTSYGTIVFLYKNFLMQRKKFADNNLFSKFGDLTSTIISFGKKLRISTDKKLSLSLHLTIIKNQQKNAKFYHSILRRCKNL